MLLWKTIMYIMVYISNSFFVFILVQEAGLRELREETGLTITPDMCVGQQIAVLAMWEVSDSFPLLTYYYNLLLFIFASTRQKV